MASSAAINSENSVKKIYLTVIEEVLTNVREAFLDEGLDEQLLQELKQLWENKLNASRAVQNPDETSANGSATSSANNSNNLRLPTTTLSNKDTTKSSNTNPVNNQNNSDIKPEVDSSTRTAIQTYSSTFSNHNLINHHIDSRTTTNGNRKSMHQVDGGVDGSSSDEDDDDDDLGPGSMHDEEDDDNKTNNEDHSECEGKEDPEPLNSDDDLTDQGSPDSQSDLFDTDHVIVCQYDKITRIKNRWKFHLKDGIMNINGRDYLFSKANGDAEW